VAEVAISLAVAAASTGLELLLAPKPHKPAPIDRGKLDDPRFSIPALGAAMPKGWGTFMTAPIWIDHTPVLYRVEVTPGSDGGKGGGGTPPTPDERKHIYTKSVIGVFHNGLVHKGVSRAWFNRKLVYNADFARNEATTSATRYEAEQGVLAGGASVVTQTECSGGRKVTGIGSGGSVTLNVDVDAAGSYEIGVYYTSTADRTFKVSANGGSLHDLVCPSSGGAGEVTSEVITLSLLSGANTIKFENSGAACPDLDRIDIAPALVFTPEGDDPRGFTGIVRPGAFGPSVEDFAWTQANELPVFSDTAGGVTNGGFFQATLSEWGNPTVRFYNGSELQEGDPIIIALRGLNLTPGYRGLGIIAIDNIQLQNGQLPNVELEVQQGVRELPAIVADIYNEVGVGPENLDLTALEGKVLGDSSGFDPGTYTAIPWSGTSNATGAAGGAIHKTSGTTNTWNSYADSGVTVAAGTDAAIRFTADAGTFMIGFAYTATPSGSLPHPYDQVPFAVLLNLNSNPSQENRNAIQMSLGGFNDTYDVGVWSRGDVFQVEYRNGRFAAYQNGLALTGFTPPVPSTFPLRIVFAGYATGGGASAASYATGANIGTEPIVANGGGLFMVSPRPAAELIAELMTRFQFTVPEIDGKVVAVLNDGPSELTIPWQEINAHRGDNRPEGDGLIVRRADPLTLPQLTTLTYSDPAFGYQTRTQTEPRLFGPQRGRTDITLNMIETAQNIKNLAIVIANRSEVESQTYSLSLGPKYMRVCQGTKLTVPARSGVTHFLRVKEVTHELPAGIVEVESVRQDAAAFSANGAVNEDGLEDPIVSVRGNTKGVFIDAPLVPPENATDPAQPMLYVAMSGRGSGTWAAGFLFREFPIDSGVYELLTGTDKPAQIGVTAGALGSVSDPTVLDAVNTLALDFHTLTSLESVTLTELQDNPKLNLIAILNGAGEWEYVQFQTVTPGVASAPYVSRYTISNLLRGRFNTVGAIIGHATGKEVVLMNNAIKAIVLSTTLIGQACSYKFVTVGQRPDEIEDRLFTWRALSLKPERPTSANGAFDQASGGLLLDWVDQSGPTADDTYDLIFRSAADGGGIIRRGPIVIKPLDLARISSTPPLIVFISGGGFLSSGSYTFIDPGGFDAVYTSTEWNTDHKIAVVEADSPFSLAGGGMVETQVAPGGGVNALFPSFWGILPTLGGDPNVHGWVKAGTTDPDTVRPRGSPIGLYNYTMVPGDRFTIQISPDGTISYYINYMGAVSHPWYVSPDKLDLTLMYRLQFDNTPYDTGISASTYTVAVRNTRWLRNVPEFTYTGEMQKADNADVLPSVVHVGIRKRSAHPLGPPSDWLYLTFTRP